MEPSGPSRSALQGDAADDAEEAGHVDPGHGVDPPEARPQADHVVHDDSADPADPADPTMRLEPQGVGDDEEAEPAPSGVTPADLTEDSSGGSSADSSPGAPNGYTGSSPGAASAASGAAGGHARSTVTASGPVASNPAGSPPSESRALVPVPAAALDLETGPLPDPRRGDVDEWGRSEHARQMARRVFDPVYERWFRAEWEGLERLPTDGGALLVANHAGAIPVDAPVIMHGIERELERPVYGLADYMFRTLPFIGVGWSRLGGVPAHPDNAYRLLREQRQLVLVFPEGTKGTGKLYKERYQLRRFGRGGFVEIAMRAGVPIVPIAVVGAEEAMPTLARAPAGIAQRLGLPYVPLTANMVALGPLGLFGYFPAKFRMRVLEPVTFGDVEPDQPRYSRYRIMDGSEKIRQRIQEELYDMLRARSSVWFG